MKPFRYIGLLLLIFLVSKGMSQELKTVHIDCDPDDFNYIYEHYQEDIYIPVTISYGGNSWAEVLLRLRGDSSREYPKKSLKAQFPTEPFYNGKTTVNFNADYNDLSYMHSVLSSLLFRKAGIESPLMEHVRVYLNGDFFGLYIMTENMDEQFIGDHGLDPDGILYKASRDGASLSIYDNIFYHWELNGGSDPYRDHLSGLIHGLNAMDQNFLAFAQSSLDYFNVTTFMAMSMLLANGSTYYHNYFLYRDDSGGKWKIFPWDLDRTFSDYPWHQYHLSSGLWTPDNPLLERAILDSVMFSDIREKVTDLSNTLINPDYLFPLMDSIRDVIAVSVGEDTTDNIPDLMVWQNKIALDKGFVVNHDDQLFFQFSQYPSSFHLHRKEGFFFPGQTVEFTWQPSEDPNQDTVSYIFYFSTDFLFEDSAALKVEGIVENEWTMAVPEVPGKYYWMVEATDGTNVIQGFDTRNELFVSTGIPEMVINEINYNAQLAFDPGDWVEFYNPGGAPVNLSDWKFMDENNEHVYKFPTGTWVGGDDYLVLCKSAEQFYSLFPDTIPAIGDLDFGFSGNGEWLRLYDPTGYLVDAVLYRPESPWPEEPDGNGPTLELLNPTLDNSLGYNWAASFGHGTPGAKNGTYSPDQIGEWDFRAGKAIRVYPNPCRDYLFLEFQHPGFGYVELQISDVFGRIVLKAILEASNPGRVNASGLAPGFYSGIVSFPDGNMGYFLFFRQ